MKIQLIRHATLLIQYNGKRILVDPMLSYPGVMDPVPNAANTLRNPLVDLTVDLNKLVQVDAVIISHLHRDHFDAAAIQHLSKAVKIFCQTQDLETLIGLGFYNTESISVTTVWEGIQLTRTNGKHGKGEMADKMGPVSGYVLNSSKEPTLYIAGDTVWCSEVERAIQKTKPDIAVLNGGAAQFLEGGPITMDKEDIQKFCEFAKETQVIVVHMEAWNHCLLKRKDLANFLQQNGFQKQVTVPLDGEVICFE